MTTKQIQSVSELEDALSAPSKDDIALMRKLQGDILILGAGGKMGPSLAKLAKRACEAAGSQRRIVAASRFGSDAARRDLESAGIHVITCDLLNPDDVSGLPRCENILYLAGRKFGSSDRPDLSWAMNAIAPSFAARHFRDSRIVAFSTGNVYAFKDVSSSGATEDEPPSPVGEYAQSCLARERIFEYYSREFGTPCLLFRLNYASDLRYGVLVDIARNVYTGEPVDLKVPAFNIIWQRDANSYALRCLDLCTSPPKVLNVTGAERVSVEEAAGFFAQRFQRDLRLRGTGGRTALLSDASLCHRLLGLPSVPATVLLEWVAQWVIAGGENLNKPTHFEVADGRF
jgi:nucleoside-diphosphate-sugar epimerase